MSDTDTDSNLPDPQQTPAAENQDDHASALEDIPTETPPPEERIPEVTNATLESACVPGQTYALTKPNPSMRVGILAAGWDLKDLGGVPVDLDLSIFMLNSKEKTRENEDFVYYNNSTGQDGSFVHEGDNRTGIGAGDDETIQMDFNKVPLNVVEVRAYITIYNPFELGHYFKMVKNVFFRIVNRETTDEILRFKFDGLIEQSTKEQAVIYVGNFERTIDQSWTFTATGELEEGSLREVAERYDMIVKQ